MPAANRGRGYPPAADCSAGQRFTCAFPDSAGVRRGRSLPADAAAGWVHARRGAAAGVVLTRPSSARVGARVAGDGERAGKSQISAILCAGLLYDA